MLTPIQAEALGKLVAFHSTRDNLVISYDELSVLAVGLQHNCPHDHFAVRSATNTCKNCNKRLEQKRKPKPDDRCKQCARMRGFHYAAALMHDFVEPDEYPPLRVGTALINA